MTAHTIKKITSLRSLRLTLRFVLPLMIALTLLAYLVVPLVDRLNLRWSVRDLAAVFASCQLYLGNDSGLSHLASWAGAEGLALFGPTEPELWAPVGAVRAVPMQGLTPERLAEAAGQILDWA